MKRIISLYFLLLKTFINGVEQLQIGNLALPTSQQPGPVFCLGQNTMNKGDIQVLCDSNIARISNEKFLVMVPAMLWGITDNFSLYWGSQYIRERFINTNRLKVLDGGFLQGEYTCYTKKTITYTNQITAVAHFVASSGNVDPRLPLNIDSASLFAGFTASHLAVDWYYYTSGGVIWSINSDKENRFGATVLYQGGFGRNIAYKTDSWLATAMVELFGKFTTRDSLRDVGDGTSKTNVFFVGPSLWFATQRLAFDLGFAFPVTRISANNPRSKTWIAAVDFRWTF